MRCMRTAATVGRICQVDRHLFGSLFGMLIAIPQIPQRVAVQPKMVLERDRIRNLLQSQIWACLPVCISTAIALKYRDPTMSSSSTQFHRIWIEQCAATKDIREAFGLKNALDYLIGRSSSPSC